MHKKGCILTTPPFLLGNYFKNEPLYRQDYVGWNSVLLLEKISVSFLIPVSYFLTPARRYAVTK